MNQAEIIREIEGMEPAMQRAYLQQIAGAVDAAVIAEVEKYIDQGDESSLIGYLAVGVFAALFELVRAGFIAGGKYESRRLPKFVGRIEFDVLAPTADAWVGERMSQVRTQISRDLLDAVRTTVAAGVQAGRTPKSVALDLVGRVSKQTGNRTGGALGLPGNFAQYVVDARTQLLSGDIEQVRRYLKRSRRDRRFDRSVLKAAEKGKALAKADVDKIVGRYADRLLRTHAEMIARTEALESFSAGRDQVYEQMVEKGFPRESIDKTWETRGDEKVRHSHSGMDGQSRKLGQPFTSTAGALLRYPGDRSLGAGYDEVANCRCQARYTIRPDYARRNAGNIR